MEATKGFEALLERHRKLLADSGDVLALAEKENRGLTDVEDKKLGELGTEADRIVKTLRTREEWSAREDVLSEGTGRKILVGKVDQNAPPEKLWKNDAEYLSAVKNGCVPGGSVDRRLLAPTAYSNEAVGPEGGFLVPPDFRSTIMQKVMAEDSLVSRCNVLPTASNNVEVPVDATTPWGTDGIQAYWSSEAALLTESKPKMETVKTKLDPLTACVPVTEEMMEDAPLITTVISNGTAAKFAFKMNNAIVAGNGVGQPLGILNSGATVAVTRTTATTIKSEDIWNMWARMYAPCRASTSCVWLINQDIEPALFKLVVAGASSDVPAYLPANGLSGSPYNTLMGKPIIPTQACSTLGTKGDIILADLSKYLILMKGSGDMAIQTAQSSHIYFLYRMETFRAVLRTNGLPWWNAAISPLNGSNTLSCFTCVAT
jgi:HK97 family phage major capsid protein